MALRKPAVIIFLVVGNIILALSGFAFAISLFVFFVLQVLDGSSKAVLLLGVGLICLLPTVIGASLLRGALGFWRGEPQGPNMTHLPVTISAAPWALMVLRGAYDLISNGTTRWEFFVPGLIVTALLLGYRRLLTLPSVRDWCSLGATSPSFGKPASIGGVQ